MINIFLLIQIKLFSHIFYIFLLKLKVKFVLNFNLKDIIIKFHFKYDTIIQ